MTATRTSPSGLVQCRPEAVGGDRIVHRLHELATTAQQLLGADFCAISLMGRRSRRWLAGSPGVPIGVSDRALTLCDRVLAGPSEVPVFLTRDAPADPALARFLEPGTGPAVRFYAGATITGAGGTSLGTVCAWSSRTAVDDLDVVSVLLHLRDAASDILAEVPDLAVALTPDDIDRLCATVLPGVGSPVSPTVDIRAVLATGAVTTVFQPVVHLESGGVVGFEALSRGPRGSDLESPLALLQAAREIDRLGELDWLCRAQALRAAAAAQLHPGLTWFVNVEPAGLTTPCPAHLVAAVTGADQVRVVQEIVERDVALNLPEIITMVDEARRQGRGIALDDVGVQPDSLMLLSAVQPDVVKLDMSLVRDLPGAAVAEISAVVRAYAEERGAVILAEGIETEEQEELARVLGADYGQGYRFGHPGPLPTSVPAPRCPIPLPPPSTTARATPYEVLTARRSPQRATMRHLAHIERHLRDRAARSTAAVLLLVNPIDATPRPRRRGPGGRGPGGPRPAVTVAVGADLTAFRDGRLFSAPLGDEDRMATEWSVVVLDPQGAAAFVARDCGEPDVSGERRFDFVYTHDHEAAVLAARCILQALTVAAPGSPPVSDQRPGR